MFIKILTLHYVVVVVTKPSRCCRLPTVVEQTLTTIYSIIIIIGTLTNFSLLAAFCTNKARDRNVKDGT